MIAWVLTFLIVAIIAGLLGFTGIAGAAAEIAQIIFLVFIVLFLISAVVSAFRGAPLCSHSAAGALLRATPRPDRAARIRGRL